MIGSPIPVNVDKGSLELIFSESYAASDWTTDAWVASGYKRVQCSPTSAQKAAFENAKMCLILIESGDPQTDTVYIASQTLIPAAALYELFKSRNKDNVDYYLPMGVNCFGTSNTKKLNANASMQFTLYRGYREGIYGGFYWYISMPSELANIPITISVYKVNI